MESPGSSSFQHLDQSSTKEESIGTEKRGESGKEIAIFSNAIESEEETKNIRCPEGMKIQLFDKYLKYIPILRENPVSESEFWMLNLGEQWVRELDNAQEIYNFMMQALSNILDMYEDERRATTLALNLSRVRPFLSSCRVMPSFRSNRYEKTFEKAEGRFRCKEVLKFQEMLKDKTKEYEHLSSSNLKQQLEIKEMEKEIKELKTRLSSHEEQTKQKLASFREKKNQEIETVMAKKNDQIQKLRKEIEKFRICIEEEKKKQRKYESQCDHKCYNKDVDSKVPVLKKKVNELKKANTKLAKKLEMDAAKALSLSEQLTSLDERAEELEEEIRNKDIQLVSARKGMECSEKCLAEFFAPEQEVPSPSAEVVPMKNLLKSAFLRCTRLTGAWETPSKHGIRHSLSKKEKLLKSAVVHSLTQIHERLKEQQSRLTHLEEVNSEMLKQKD